MDAYSTAFWLPKEGSSESEYEDAFFPRADRVYQVAKRPRFAIADGATETSFSGLWARQLVSAFVRRGLGMPPTTAELKPIQERWKTKVAGRSLPWYAEEKMAYGAFAALLGLEFSEEQSEGRTVRTWHAIAAGDCCLVQLRANDIISAFPFVDSGAFNNRPDLLGSLPTRNGHETHLVKISKGTLACDDSFLLMSDALACWFFKAREGGKEPWNMLRDLETQGEVSFQKFIADLWQSDAMRKDDVTLLRINIG